MSQAQTYAGKERMDKVAAKAAEASAAADNKLKDAQTDLAIQEGRAKAADAERRRKEATKTRKLEAKTQRREKKAAARRARNERLAASLGQPLPWVMTVVVTSIAFAFPGQFLAVVTLGVFWALALLVPVFIEGATWAMAWLRKWAVENNKPAKLYTVMTWLFASVAAGLNAWHHADKPELAVVFAASSLFGVAVFEIYMHSQMHRVGGRSAEEIKLALLRRIKHPRVARRAVWLRTATMPPLSEAEAWERAWRQLRGAEPGVTKRLLKRHGKQAAEVAKLVEASAERRPTASLEIFDAPPARVREVPANEGWMIDREAIAKVLADPANGRRADRATDPASKIKNGSEGLAQEPAQGPHAPASHSANGQVMPNDPPSARGRKKGAGAGGAKPVSAARALAAETARAATPEQAEAEKKAAREWAVEQLRADREIGWRDVQKHISRATDGTVRGETWCRERLREARAEVDAESPLKLVANR
ncbi:DUF2637 domain-containing protein [Streptomyces violarus]|uniref:hypothetical protein n=1 Tax=Streptomyces violarus TaxID=67380 RepID=UPI0021BF943D|nr:hypothetical protein [Streptomyces violarus]MCT9142425.1 hypothetical protein [Streptomyces violarus]